MSAKVKIFLNGEEFLVNENSTVADLINSLELDLKKVAVEKDLLVLHPESFSSETMQEGARIEIVHFIGGG